MRHKLSAKCTVFVCWIYSYKVCIFCFTNWLIGLVEDKSSDWNYIRFHEHIPDYVKLVENISINFICSAVEAPLFFIETTRWVKCTILDANRFIDLLFWNLFFSHFIHFSFILFFIILIVHVMNLFNCHFILIFNKFSMTYFNRI